MAMANEEIEDITEENRETADQTAQTEGAAGAVPADDVPACDSPENADDVPCEEGNEISRVDELERQITELKDQYLRKVADFENFRKRTTREKQEAIEYGNTSLLMDIIQIKDDFERALKSVEGDIGTWAESFKGFYDGVSMIEKRLSAELENKWGLKRFDSAGEAFDPNRHEALMMEKSPDISEAQVAEDFLKGYTLKDRVIRPAKVKVLMPE